MNITLTGTKIAQDTKFLAFEKNSGVDVINITVDTDESWIYKLDVKYPNKCCSGEQLYNIINLTRNGNVCTVVLTKDMLPFTGKYMMQLRAISGDKVYHSDTFDCWVKYSIEPASTYNPVPSEFYQIEQNVTEMNNHPPKPGQNGYWLVWDITTSQYEESAIPLPDGMLPDMTADTSGKYLSNDGTKAYWAEVQTGTESKIDRIEVNGVEQPIIDKTVNIAVPTKTSDLSNDLGYITNEALDGYAKTTDIPTKTSQLDNDSHYITANKAPVQSVNTKTGDVVLGASDVGALPADTVIPTVNDAILTIRRNSVDIGSFKANSANDVNIDINVPTDKSDIGLGNVDNVKQYSASNPPPYPVTSVNGHTGAITIREVPAVTTSDNGKFLRVVNGVWAAVAIADANGVKF